MDDSQPTQRPGLSVSGLVAALLVMFALWVLYWRFSGDAAPDWEGYGRLYDNEGGWLLKKGRDPGFVWLISQARAIFGHDNYAEFRFSLFCVFTVFAAWLAARMPEQDAVRPITSLVTALIVVLAFLLKGLAQIREGIALLFIVAPAVTIFRDQRGGIFRSGVGIVVAAVIHAGTVFLSGAWLAAVGIWLLPNRIVSGVALQRILLALSVLVGVILGLTVLRNINDVNFLLQDFGATRWASAQSGLWKYLYWIANGAFVIMVRHQLLASVKTAQKFAFAYATAIGTILLPAIYSICLVLVVTNFQFAAVASMAMRVLFTATELALIIIALRGRADLGTAALAIAMLADRARLLAIP